MLRLLPSISASLAFVSLGSIAVAQCGLAWLPGYGCPGTNGSVTAMTRWDPDGAGPAPEVVVLGGWFSVAGDIACDGLATLDPATGTFAAIAPPPLPIPGELVVAALTVLPTGELVVGYRSSAIYNLARVATFDGAAWTVLGADFADQVNAIHVRPNGDLVAGGAFASVAGSAFGGIARWNGVAWQAVGGGVDGPVQGFADETGGALLACGSFATAGATAVGGVARWNGTAWTAVGGAVSYPNAVAVVGGQVFVASYYGLLQLVGGVWSVVPGLAAGPYSQAQIDGLAVLANGHLVASGVIDSVGGIGTRGIAELDPVGGTWTTFGLGLGDNLLSPRARIVELASGDLVVGGAFSVADGSLVAGLARWNGTQWSSFGTGPGPTSHCAVVIDDVTFAIGGDFPGSPYRHVMAWNGSAWTPLGGGLGGPVQDLVRLPNGDLVAAGAFAVTGTGAVARGLARWDGSSWSELGGGLQYFANVGVARELLVRANGDLVVVGAFTSAGGVACANIAIWNGVAWSSPGGGLPAAATNIAEGPTGDLFVATSVGSGLNLQCVQRWDGAAWTIVHTLQNAEGIEDLAVLADGSLAVAGTLSLFYGSQWRGFFEAVHGGFVDRYDSFDLRTRVFGLVPLPGGDVLVSGTFASLAPPVGAPVFGNGCVRWSSTSGAFVPSPDAAGVVDATVFPNGDLLLCGSGLHVPGQALWQVARLASTCPAASTSGGAGCSGSGGANVLTTTRLPWLGDTCSLEATGMPAQGIAVGVRGLGTQSLLLATVLPQAAAGCTLLVTPDLLDLYLPVAGRVAIDIPLPNIAALVGMSFAQQVVAFEITAVGGIGAVTSTNRQMLTIGVF